MTSIEDFSQQVERAAARLQQAQDQPGLQDVEELRAELHLAVEELHVAEEELHLQQDELIAARDGIEAERLRYQRLFATAPAALVITDRDGLLREVNHAAAQLLDLDPVRLPTTSLVSHVAAEDRRRVRQALVRLGEQQSTVVHTRLSRSGAAVDVRMTVDSATGAVTWLLMAPQDQPTPVTSAREAALLQLVGQVATHLSADFDVIDMLTRVCEGLVQVLGIDACGVLLAHGHDIEVAAVSGQDAHAVELAQLQKGAGPCLEAIRRGEVVVVAGRHGIERAWPDISVVSESVGIRSIAAFPLRGADGVMGTLNTFRRDDMGFAPHDLATCEAMAQIVVLALVNARVFDHSQEMVDHLRHALESRVVIEQAKGIIARDRQVDMQSAFDLLRGTARRRRVKLHALAADVVGGWADPAELG